MKCKNMEVDSRRFRSAIRVAAGLLAGVAIYSGCVATPEHMESSANIFHSPERYVGEVVTLCGYIHDRFEDGNIWPSREMGGGVGFIPSRSPDVPSDFDGKVACVTGQIVETGCGASKICTWSSYRFALKQNSESGFAPR